MVTFEQTAHVTQSTNLIPALNAWKMYLTDQNRSLHTIKAFIADLTLLTDFLAPDKTLGAITTDELNQFVSWLEKGRGVPCSPKSLSRRITSLKSFFSWLHKNGVVSINPAEKVLQQSVISPLPEVLSASDIEVLYDTANKYRMSAKPDARFYALFRLLMETGIKKGECLAIDLNHLDIEHPDGPTLFIRYADPRNRFKERKIVLSTEWVEAFKEYSIQYKPKNQLFPWSQRRLEYLLEDLGKAAGLSKHLSFDMCRWSSVLQDYREGKDPDTIRQKLGISKIQWREIAMKLKELSAK